jgi:hypothetical protein
MQEQVLQESTSQSLLLDKFNTQALIWVALVIQVNSHLELEVIDHKKINQDNER